MKKLIGLAMLVLFVLAIHLGNRDLSRVPVQPEKAVAGTNEQPQDVAVAPKQMKMQIYPRLGQESSK